jgi:hypothetical protein
MHYFPLIVFDFPAKEKSNIEQEERMNILFIRDKIQPIVVEMVFRNLLHRQTDYQCPNSSTFDKHFSLHS